MRVNFVSTLLSTSGRGMCFIFPLRSNTDPFECTPCTHAELPALLLYYESVRLPIWRIISLPLSGLLMTSVGIRLALPGSVVDSSVARHGLRPRHVSMHSPLRAYHFRLQENETLGLRATKIISGLNTFTCVVADFLLYSGFIQSVALPHAEFRTELVVTLYSGWIVQLVNASFAWRTHFVSLSAVWISEPSDRFAGTCVFFANGLSRPDDAPSCGSVHPPSDQNPCAYAACHI